MKKILAIVMALVLVFSLAACGSKSGSETKEPEKAAVKVGFIFLHDENSTYDLNFITGAKPACEETGVEYLLKTNIPESHE